MAVLLEERTVRLELADLSARRPIARPGGSAAPLPRASGWHASDLLRDIALEYGWIKPRSIDDQESYPSDYPWRWAGGIMFEEYWFSFPPDPNSLTGAAPIDTIWQPGERTHDGISVNADGITTVAVEAGGKYAPFFPLGAVAGVIVEETKNTEKKVRTGEEFLGERMWLHQGRGYVLRYVPDAEVCGGVARWTVYHSRGDYAGLGPIVKQYVVGFGAAEIRNSWELLVERKRVLEERGVRPPGGTA